MSVCTHAARATLMLVAFSLSIESVSALTLRERWLAEQATFQRLSGSICYGCGAKPTASGPAHKQYAALVDPIAVLERSSRATAKFLAGDTSTTRGVPTVITDRTLASVHRRATRSYAQMLARRRYAKLVRSRRYAELAYRRRAQAAARAAAARYEIEFGQVRRILE